MAAITQVTMGRPRYLATLTGFLLTSCSTPLVYLYEVERRVRNMRVARNSLLIGCPRWDETWSGMFLATCSSCTTLEAVIDPVDIVAIFWKAWVPSQTSSSSSFMLFKTDSRRRWLPRA